MTKWYLFPEYIGRLIKKIINGSNQYIIVKVKRTQVKSKRTQIM